MDTRWHIRLLGTLEAKQGNTIISRFATSRVAALLARLALHPHRTHSREELAGLLWPEADGDAGRLNLRVALASLRRQIEPPGCPAGSVLITDRLSIRFHPQACFCDAAQFEAAVRDAARTADPSQKREKLEQALALYEGELLPGFYDEWVLEERERLQALCDDAKWQCRALPHAERPQAPDKAQALDRADIPQAALLGFPGRLTRFFGRTAEQSRLVAMLADPEVRLVTLLGPGGAGKTRLALETARQAAKHFDGPVCFVPLADISDSALIASTIASSLRLLPSGDQAPRDQIAAHLVSARSLLVLDNLEHLGDAGAAEVQALLEAASHLTCLATSRQKLGIAGEHELPLSPLPVPPTNEGEPALALAVSLLTDYPGVQLFVDRAQSVRPDFQVTPQNAAAIASVCRSLEGMPLALELAAARIQALSPEQMRLQLAARLDFLTSRRRDLPARHRSLRAALEWSVHLLSPEQTRFFAQLSVFRGGWSLEAAAAVCEVPAPLDLLEQLCERSLISTVEASSEIRFRMLESLREFGEEQLAPEEKTALSRRHAAYCQNLAAAMDAAWCGPGQKNAQSILDAEQDNLRAALSFCRTDRESNEIGLRTAGTLGNYWTVRGLLHEGLDWLKQALAGQGSDDARARALAMSGWLTGGLCDYPKAKALLTKAIEMTRPLGDQKALSAALRMRGVITLWENKHSPAADLDAALALSCEGGDDASTAIVLNSLGVMAEQWERDQQKAQRLYEEALVIFLRLGDQQRAAYCLHNLGNIAHDDGDYARAESMLRHSLELADALGDSWHRAYCLRSLGDVFMAQNALDEAAARLEEGSALCRQLGDKMIEAGTLLSLARVRRRQGRFADADQAAQAGLRLYQSLGSAEGVTEGWMLLAETAAAQSDWPAAAALLSAAETSRTKSADDTEQRRADTLCQSARAALSTAAFSAAWLRGRTLTCDNYGLR
jgi:predicted ATPase